MKGVYVIHDKETGQRYVGSAYGDTGIWQRWTTYAATLHGGNVGLKALLEDKGDEYYRTNMRFALLEYWSMRTDDDHVLRRAVVLEGRAPRAIIGTQQELTDCLAMPKDLTQVHGPANRVTRVIPREGVLDDGHSSLHGNAAIPIDSNRTGLHHGCHRTDRRQYR